MSPEGRPEGESGAGARSAKGGAVSPKGRSRAHQAWSAQREG